MKVLLILLSMLPSMRRVEYARIQLDTVPIGILMEYRNANFSQRIQVQPEGMMAETRSLNFVDLKLNYRIHLDPVAASALDPEVKAQAMQFLGASNTLKDYLVRIRDFLRSHVQYSPKTQSQDPLSVLRRRTADCVGLAGLVNAWLDAVGIRNRNVRGFYLRPGEKGNWIPEPHRWLEINLHDGFSFFFDPQHRVFSPRYLVVRRELDFHRVRRFRVRRMKLQTKLENG